MEKPRVVIVGGGAAGIFAAIEIAEKLANEVEIIVLEQGYKVLQKVRISGGGRCNVTNACFDINELILNYPRGAKALRGPFTRFGPANIMQWFEDRGVALKIEDDNRVFPRSDKSESIIDCLLNNARKYKIRIATNSGVKSVKEAKNGYLVQTKDDEIPADAVVIACGSNYQIWQMLQNMGHEIVPAVPSLFSFNIKNKLIEDLQGISVPNALISIPDVGLSASGPLLITHWGLSGPGILKLSAWGARLLFEKHYKFDIHINWVGENVLSPIDIIREKIARMKEKQVETPLFPELPKRLWQRFWMLADIIPGMKWKQVSPKQMLTLSTLLFNCKMEVTGKSTFKDEFVTAGGVALDEIDFRTMESKLLHNLFLAGEVIDVDAVTGGFNFQNAWTTGWIAGQTIIQKYES
jgi:predicted Rossmann fold flavoprotein